MGAFQVIAGIVLSSFLLADLSLGAPDGRIVGGQAAKLGQFPYQVLLKSQKGTMCGGSIISKNYVLMAAHCVYQSSASDNRVVAGSVTLSEEGQSRDVAAVIVHPNYKIGSFDYDIALLKLKNPFSFNSNVKAVPIHTGPIPAGAKVIITGFGGISNGGPISQVLKWNTVTALSDDDCRKMTGPNNGGRLCLTKSRGNGICGGDSGGPAVYNGRLVGVANFHLNECGSDLPDGFIKVPFFLDWIKKNSDL